MGVVITDLSIGNKIHGLHLFGTQFTCFSGVSQYKSTNTDAEAHSVMKLRDDADNLLPGIRVEDMDIK